MQVILLARRLARATSGVALLEFAIGLPVFLTLVLAGAETTNWIITKMRVSQLALHVADNAARMGDGTLMQAKSISETDINDVLTGAGLQSSELDIFKNGRIILSDVERIAKPNPSNKVSIVWQRCRGDVAHPSQYGTTTSQAAAGIGPAGQQINAQDDNPTMFVEVFYNYKPLVSDDLVPATTFDEIASMSVRDRRSPGILNAEGAPVSKC